MAPGGSTHVPSGACAHSSPHSLRDASAGTPGGGPAAAVVAVVAGAGSAVAAVLGVAAVGGLRTGAGAVGSVDVGAAGAGIAAVVGVVVSSDVLISCDVVVSSDVVGPSSDVAPGGVAVVEVAGGVAIASQESNVSERGSGSSEACQKPRNTSWSSRMAANSVTTRPSS